ncbi:MAG: hypothetical protein HZC42_06280 [Candidatus Eisenbacteria bacterium]|nr:hypothetical protein [Candidatus Eisenbacteria bacterium]
MLGTGFVLAMLALVVPTAGVPSRGPAIAPAPATDGPAAALQALGRAYSDRSLEDVGALLTGDFQFHTTDARMASHFPDGIARDRELQVVSGLIHGVTRDGEVVMPAADSIKVTLDGLTEGPDPEHPDSTGHYRLVAVRRFRFDIRLPDDRTFESTSALHVFHLVRGDAAVRVPGQPGNANRWYIRRWLEDVDALVVALGNVEGDCDRPRPQPVRADSAEGGGPPPKSFRLNRRG